MLETLADQLDDRMAPDLQGCNDVDSHEMLPIHMWPDVFGEAGRHARSAVGVTVLPLGVAVEVDAIVAVKA